MWKRAALYSVSWKRLVWYALYHPGRLRSYQISNVDRRGLRINLIFPGQRLEGVPVGADTQHSPSWRCCHFLLGLCSHQVDCSPPRAVKSLGVGCKWGLSIGFQTWRLGQISTLYKLILCINQSYVSIEVFWELIIFFQYGARFYYYIYFLHIIGFISLFHLSCSCIDSATQTPESFLVTTNDDKRNYSHNWIKSLNHKPELVQQKNKVCQLYICCFKLL